MKFQQRHFEAVAATLRKAKPNYIEVSRPLWNEIVLHFCTLFLADNPRFDVARFQKACGFPELPELEQDGRAYKKRNGA